MTKSVTFLPTPFEGEHFAGLMARWSALQNVAQPSIGLEGLMPECGALSNQRIYHPLLDIAAEAYDGAVSRKTLLAKHSLLPYYSATMHFQMLDKILNKRVKTGGLWKTSKLITHIPMISAPCYQTLSFTSSWRFCPDCVSEDEGRLGTAFWHVKHQIPSTLTCDKHGCELVGACKNCGFTISDIRHYATPPVGNICPNCSSGFESSLMHVNEQIAWVQRASMDLLKSPGPLNKPYFEHVMKRGIQRNFSRLVKDKERQSVVIAYRLQHEFESWFFDNRFEVFYRERCAALKSQTLSLEQALGNVNGWHPLGVLMWHRFLAVEWPLLESAA